MCGGVEIILTEPASYRSVEAAIHMFDTFRKLSPDSLVWNPPSAIRRLEEPGMTVEDIVKVCQDEVADFIKVREKYLLYR